MKLVAYSVRHATVEGSTESCQLRRRMVLARFASTFAGVRPFYLWSWNENISKQSTTAKKKKPLLYINCTFRDGGNSTRPELDLACHRGALARFCPWQGPYATWVGVGFLVYVYCGSHRGLTYVARSITGIDFLSR